MVTRRSAKPPCEGSIPSRASSSARRTSEQRRAAWWAVTPGVSHVDPTDRTAAAGPARRHREPCQPAAGLDGSCQVHPRPPLVRTAGAARRLRRLAFELAAGSEHRLPRSRGIFWRVRGGHRVARRAPPRRAAVDAAAARRSSVRSRLRSRCSQRLRGARRQHPRLLATADRHEPLRPGRGGIAAAGPERGGRGGAGRASRGAASWHRRCACGSATALRPAVAGPGTCGSRTVRRGARRHPPAGPTGARRNGSGRPRHRAQRPRVAIRSLVYGAIADRDRL